MLPTKEEPLEPAAGLFQPVTLTNDSDGDSTTDIVSLPTASPDPEDTPFIPCRAIWARCFCNGVCVDGPTPKLVASTVPIDDGDEITEVRDGIGGIGY